MFIFFGLEFKRTHYENTDHLRLIRSSDEMTEVSGFLKEKMNWNLLQFAKWNYLECGKAVEWKENVKNGKVWNSDPTFTVSFT